MLLCAMNLITKDKGRRIMFHKKSFAILLQIFCNSHNSFKTPSEFYIVYTLY